MSKKYYENEELKDKKIVSALRKLAKSYENGESGSTGRTLGDC